MLAKRPLSIHKLPRVVNAPFGVAGPDMRCTYSASGSRFGATVLFLGRAAAAGRSRIAIAKHAKASARFLRLRVPMTPVLFLVRFTASPSMCHRPGFRRGECAEHS